MDVKIAVYASWFIFAIWCYIVLVYTISSIWFAKTKAIKTFWDKRAITLETIFFILTLIGQIFTIVLYVDSGKNLINSNTAATTEYWVLISLNFFFILCYISFYLFFSNNLAVKFTEDKTYLIGMSVLNSAFITVKKSSKEDVILEYVYNQNKNKKWTEKLKFFKFFKSTEFIWNNYKTFINPERNLSFFNIYKVTKSQDAKVKDAKIQDAKVKDAKVKDAKVKDAKVKDAKVKDAKVKDEKTAKSQIPTRDLKTEEVKNKNNTSAKNNK